MIEQLKADLQTYYHHDKTQERFDTLLRYAEAEIRLAVQSSDIEWSETGDVVAGKPFVEIPDDLLVIQRLLVYTHGTQESSKPAISPLSGEHLTDAGGPPLYYNKLDQVLMLYPTPSADYEYTLYYIPEIRPLTFANPTNAIVDKAPQIYLYALLEQAATMLEDFERVPVYKALFLDAVTGLQSESGRKKYPTSTPLRMKFRASA